MLLDGAVFYVLLPLGLIFMLWIDSDCMLLDYRMDYEYSLLM